MNRWKLMAAVLVASVFLAAPSSTVTAMQSTSAGAPQSIWQPAKTPRGGVSWKLLESTREIERRDSDGFLVSKPQFPPRVRALEGKRIKVAGWMLPLESKTSQKHFVLLAYPPECPFHIHARPMQFIEVRADKAFPTDERSVHVVSGVLKLTGQDESGIFYQLHAARPG